MFSITPGNVRDTKSFFCTRNELSETLSDLCGTKLPDYIGLMIQ